MRGVELFKVFGKRRQNFFAINYVCLYFHRILNTLIYKRFVQHTIEVEF